MQALASDADATQEYGMIGDIICWTAIRKVFEPQYLTQLTLVDFAR